MKLNQIQLKSFPVVIKENACRDQDLIFSSARHLHSRLLRISVVRRQSQC